MPITQEQYDSLEVGQFYVVEYPHGKRLMEKLKPIPPVIPQSNADHGPASDDDMFRYPHFEGGRG